MNLDLDEMEVSLGYLEEWKQLIKELRAARGVVEIAKFIEENLGSWEGPNATGSPELNAAVFKRVFNRQREALRQYDEARQG